MKTKITLVSLAFLLFSASLCAQNSTPSATVKAFYKFHLIGSGIFNTEEVKARSRWFTPELNTLLLRELKREAEYLKANPTHKPHFGDGFPGQPYEECSKDGKGIKNVYSVGNATVIGNKATVQVRFSNPKACGGDLIGPYKLSLIKTKTKWRIADGTYPHGETLTADLKRKEY
ncbi:MAG: hypothetical protein WKF92_00120 [Pyrinomonadaceae bacterium]